MTIDAKDRKAIGEAATRLCETPERDGDALRAERRHTLWSCVEVERCAISTEAFDRIEVAVRAAHESGAAAERARIVDMLRKEHAAGSVGTPAFWARLIEEGYV